MVVTNMKYVFVTWQLIVTLDSIRNSCDVFRDMVLEDELQIVKLETCTVGEVLRFIDGKKRQHYALSSDTKGRFEIYILSKVVKSQLKQMQWISFIRRKQVYGFETERTKLDCLSISIDHCKIRYKRMCDQLVPSFHFLKTSFPKLPPTTDRGFDPDFVKWERKKTKWVFMADLSPP